MPIALMGFAVYLAALYISTILVGALIGSALVGPDHSDARHFGLALRAGLAVVVVLFHLPFVGWPVHIVMLLAGPSTC
jgi:Kef-type K+ transport system membrane component KefB